MKVVMADIEAEELEQSANDVRKLAASPSDVLAVPTDVSKLESLISLRDVTQGAFGKDVAVLMANAGTGVGGGVLASDELWHKVIDVNGWGVINTVRCFLPSMLEQATPAWIIGTGSKQGITAPPGNLAYNISKSMVKLFTEGLAHELRNGKNPAITAHLLVPGWVATGITGTRRPSDGNVVESAVLMPTLPFLLTVKTAKALGQDVSDFKGSWEGNAAPGAWKPQQTVDYMLARLAQNDFYIICPDNETSEEMDKKRIAWAAQDIYENRPALSRWHPDWAAKFKEYMDKL